MFRMDPILTEACEQIASGIPVGRDTLMQLTSESVSLDDLMYCANRIRREHFQEKVSFCSIVNAKSGNCSEDCGFCAQSAHFSTGISKYRLMPVEEILKAAREAEQNDAVCFGVVLAVRGPSERDLVQLEEVFRTMRRELRLRVGASIGILSYEAAVRLREAGLEMVNHNLETSERHFPKICTTHTYQERIDTLRNCRRAGLEVCSGGIFGMGEDWQDRVDMLVALQEFEPENVPLNFLHPIDGTPLGTFTPLTPREILRCISVARFAFPRTPIGVMGGRTHNLGDMQSWMIHAGATGGLIGNYLTTIGRSPEEDRRMVEDLGFRMTSSRQEMGGPSRTAEHPGGRSQA